MFHWLLTFGLYNLIVTSSFSYAPTAVFLYILEFINTISMKHFIYSFSWHFYPHIWKPYLAFICISFTYISIIAAMSNFNVMVLWIILFFTGRAHFHNTQRACTYTSCKMTIKFQALRKRMATATKHLLQH